MFVYVASSWRNPHQANVVRLLRMDHGRDNVYDYRHPDPANPHNEGFSWKDVDDGVAGREPDAATTKPWDLARLSRAVEHPIAAASFALDAGALDKASACVLVLPCGRSAHLELGYAAGKGKLTVVYAPKGTEVEPELMYRLCDYMFDDLDLVREALTKKRTLPRWQRDVAEVDAKREMRGTGRFFDDADAEGPCRQIHHRVCHGCGFCWRHGACICSPDDLYAAMCQKRVKSSGLPCDLFKDHLCECRDGDHYP